MMISQKNHNKDLRDKAKAFENKMTYEEMRMAGKRLQEETQGAGLDQANISGSQFYRTTRGAMGTSMGMQGCLNSGNNYGYVARVRDMGVAKHRLQSAGV